MIIWTKNDDKHTNLYQKHVLAYLLALDNSLFREYFIHVTGNADIKLENS